MHDCFRVVSVVIALLPATATWAQAPANSELVVNQEFEAGPLDSQVWKTSVGEWKVVNGVLTGNELEDDNHAAALRRVVETQNAVYQLRFRFSDKSKAFHFGFDPAKGELDKKGHLFSVIATPQSVRILKHVDKNRPDEFPNKVLTQTTMQLKAGQWYSLKVTCWGPYVTAKIDDLPPLQASDPTFRVRKPTLVFRCSGSGLEIDDLLVYRQL